jgi:hypothetical protein
VGVVCKHVSESFALKVLNVSFLGVSLLLKGRLGRGFGARFGGVHTGAGEKHVVRAGGNLSAGTFNAGSKEQKPDNGRGFGWQRLTSAEQRFRQMWRGDPRRC